MGPKGAVEILFRKEIAESDEPQATTDAKIERVPREVRASVRRGGPRLPRRHHRSARYAAAPHRGARDAAHQARPESAEEARQHPALMPSSRVAHVRSSMFDKVLVANRGEIALRVIRACRELGVAVGRRVLRGRRARAARARGRRGGLLGPAPSSESYLKGDASSRRRSGSAREAIHPGYGFLSEREWFARAVRDAGLVFIGPPAEAIAAMGSKTAARAARDRRRGRPSCRARRRRCATRTRRAQVAEQFGYPVLLKAAAGGGGKGMRVVRDARSSQRRSTSAQREAKNAFGDDAVYVEKYIVGPRHVEIQVLGDQHGTMLHLGERECSIQRRHQKMIEEAPSVAVSPELRARMGAAAVRRGACGRLRQRGHLRVPARRGRRVLLPRDEHAHPGRASGHRARDGHRPRAVAAPHRGGRAAAVHAGGHRAARLGDRVPHHERGPGERLPAVDRPRAVPARAERARRALGRRHRDGQRGRAVTTIRCSRS